MWLHAKAMHRCCALDDDPHLDFEQGQSTDRLDRGSCTDHATAESSLLDGSTEGGMPRLQDEYVACEHGRHLCNLVGCADSNGVDSQTRRLRRQQHVAEP